VRELRHRVEQAVILTNNEHLSTVDLNLSSETGIFRSLDTAREFFEKSYILKALQRHDFNVSQTAGSLGISRQYLHELIKKLNIPRPGDSSD
jgi:DNA-binding NtrC family response regulator